MLFSERFGITRTEEDDWFDPVLAVDTRLFLDPFLIYASEFGYFEGSHAEVIRFFDAVFKLVAASGGDRTSARYQKAVNDLVFPEVKELCLGYTVEGTNGLGGAIEIARLIAGGLREAIQAGLEEITHFEEVGILKKNIGADRISDITAGLLRRRLADYTLAVCVRHGIPTQERQFDRGWYDPEQRRWLPLALQLPENPENGRGILLAPRRYLRSLPTINSDDFWEYCYHNENDTLRAEFNFDITSRVNKDVIVDLARCRPDLLKKYLKETEGQDPVPYDFDRDKEGVAHWYAPTKDYCERHPILLDSRSSAALINFVDAIILRFRHFVEQEDGWRLLWDGNRRKNEPAARYLFLGIVMQYCRANQVAVDKPALVGRDCMTLSAENTSVRALLEMKLAATTRFWNNLHAELPGYGKAESADLTRFVVATFSVADDDRYSEITKIVGGLNARYAAKLVRVDASSDDATTDERATVVQFVAKDNAVIHVGDNNITIEGNAAGSAIGPGASVEARDISSGEGGSPKEEAS